MWTGGQVWRGVGKCGSCVSAGHKRRLADRPRRVVQACDCRAVVVA